MARPLRLEFPGALYHVTARGNERHAIVRDEDDRQQFLGLLARTVSVFRWTLHAYVLMTNHYHLLVETAEPNLSRGMRQLNGIYGQAFNRRHGRVGHLFQGRFNGILVEKEAHLLALCRYVVLNPVRAGLAAQPGAWRWGNYRATAGLVPAPEWLEVRWTLEQFSPVVSRAQRLYREFVGEKDVPSPWGEVTGQIYLGGEDFRKGLEERAQRRGSGREIPRAQRRPGRPGLAPLVTVVARVYQTTEAAIRHGRGGDARTLVAYLGRTEGTLKLREIGEALSLDIGRVSRLAAEGEGRLATDAGFRAKVRHALKMLTEKSKP